MDQVIVLKMIKLHVLLLPWQPRIGVTGSH